MAKKTTGGIGAFTYDFGIMISRDVVGRLERVARNTLTLAGAYYALNRQATEYVATLRKQQIFFGGQVSTMRAIADAQDRIIRGASRFDVSDQLEGMNNLMRVGIDARKEFAWTEKAAHAMGVSYSQFSNAIANGIRGNMGGLVEMGLISERATRMFEKYQGNTVMRQQAILNFVKQHKGLQAAIAQDFGTIQDEMRRLTTVWKGFLQAILGQPNDPHSFYGQVRSALKEVADGFARNFRTIQRYAFQIGQVLGWVIRQIGHVVTWLGSKVKNALQTIWKVGEDYQERVRSVLVWLEFQKLALLGFFKEYEKGIKTVIKWLVVYAVASRVITWSIPKLIAVRSGIVAVSVAIRSLIKFIRTQGLIKGLERFTYYFLPGLNKAIKLLGARIAGLGKIITGAIRKIGLAFTSSNPIGWILLGIAAVIAALVILYKKCEPFRNVVNDLAGLIVQKFRFVWNMLVLAYVKIRIAYKRIRNGLQEFWQWLKSKRDWIINDLTTINRSVEKLWNNFMNTKVGRWLNDNLIQPLKEFFNDIASFFDRTFGRLSRWIKDLKGWFGMSADAVGNYAAELAASEGFRAPVWNSYAPSGGNSTEGATSAATPSVATAPPTPVPQGLENVQSYLDFREGAIQIILQGTTGVNEETLAQKVREIILDLERNGKIRGGRS